MKYVISVLLLAAALIGFYLLQWPNAVLFLLFLIIAYPPALATTVADEIPSRDIVQMYRIGVSQIPALGGIINALMNRNSGPPRSRR
jgi:hypothetical protein